MNRGLNMNKKLGWLIFIVLLTIGLSSVFYIPYAPAYLSVPLGNNAAMAVSDLLGMIFCICSAIVAWVSFPRIHNFRVSWIGILIPALFGAYFILNSIPATSMVVLPLYLSGILVLIHLILFLILPDTAKRRTMVLSIGSVLLIQTILIVLLAIYGNRYIQYPDNPIINQREFLIVLYSIFLGAAVIVVWRSEKNQFYLGTMVISLVLFTLIFIIRKLFPYDHYGWTNKILGVYFIGMMVLMNLGILAHWFVRIENKVNYDPLLKIYNRQYCIQVMEEKTKLKTTVPFTMAMIDIDHFKKVNDTYGHQAGDDVLYAVAQKVQQSILPSGVVTRFGGEELVLFFPGKRSSEVSEIMEQARFAVQSMKVHTEHKIVSVTVSVGICERPDNGVPLEKVLKATDTALYKAKKEGRNCIRIARIAGTKKPESRLTEIISELKTSSLGKPKSPSASKSKTPLKQAQPPKKTTEKKTSEKKTKAKKTTPKK